VHSLLLFSRTFGKVKLAKRTRERGRGQLLAGIIIVCRLEDAPGIFYLKNLILLA
jgi:hypothetical protein